MPKENQVQIITHAPPPPKLPVYQRANPREVSFFGRTNFAAALEEKRFVFGIKRADRSQHMFITGRSGMGKSKLLELLIRQDIACGRGLCVIDLAGDVVRGILDFIPVQRLDDVVLIDAGDKEFPVAFNPLSLVPREFHPLVTQGLIDVMARELGVYWNPRLEYLFRSSCPLLLEYPGATMKSFVSLLADEEYRRRALDASGDEGARRFWQNEFPRWHDRFETETVIPLANKFSQFFANPFLGSIFTRPESKIDFREIMRQDRILLINLAREQIGAESAGFLGSLFLIKLKEAALARSLEAQKPYGDFCLYIDEFPAFLTSTFETFLAEAHRFGLTFTLAQRHLFELPHDASSRILGACGTLVVFRQTAEDARRLEMELAPIFKARDMINLGVQEFYIKMAIDGNVSDPFSAETLAVLAPRHRSFREEIIRASRSRYARLPVALSS